MSSLGRSLRNDSCFSISEMIWMSRTQNCIGSMLVFISMNVEEDSAMFDAVWYLDCILPSSVVLFMECMGYRFMKGRNSHWMT